MSIDHAAVGDRAAAQVRFGDVVLRRTPLPVHRTMIDGAARHAADAVRLLIVRSGSLTITHPGQAAIRLREGEALFTGRGRAYRTDESGTVVLSSTEPAGELPVVAHRSGGLPLVPIARAPLVDAMAEAMSRLIDERATSGGPDPGYVGAGLINLQCAVLAELRRREGAGAGPDRVVDRAIAHIEQRLDVVAAAVREDPSMSLEALVLRSGLPSVAAMERSFRRRFGHPIATHAGGDTVSASSGTDRGLPDTSQL